MAEAPTPAPAAPAAKAATGAPAYSINELVSSRAAAWGVRPAMIRAALHGKGRVSLADAEKLVTDFAKQKV